MGMDAGRAAISSLWHLEIGPIPHSETDVFLRRVAWTGAATSVQGIFFENATRGRITTGVINALDVGVRAGIDSEFPFNISVDVLKATLAAALTTSHSGIALRSRAPKDSWCRSKLPWMAEVEGEAIKAGIRSGNTALPPYPFG